MRFSLNVSGQFGIGQPHPSGLSRLTSDLFDIVNEFGGQVDISRHSSHISYGWRGENLDNQNGLLEGKIEELRKEHRGIDFIIAREL